MTARERRDDAERKGRKDAALARSLGRNPAHRSAATYYRQRAARHFATAERWQQRIDEEEAVLEAAHEEYMERAIAAEERRIAELDTDLGVV